MSDYNPTRNYVYQPGRPITWEPDEKIHKPAGPSFDGWNSYEELAMMSKADAQALVDQANEILDRSNP